MTEVFKSKEHKKIGSLFTIATMGFIPYETQITDIPS